MKPADEKIDYLIIGGGFYGCCLALILSSLSARVMLVEAGGRLMDRASRVNQARIHTGFHYPRSALTAVKSLTLHRKFIEHFSGSVVSDFRMLYAIARRHSRVSAKRFYRMFRDMGAPIEPATASDTALFDMRHVEAVFSCAEAAFNYEELRRFLADRLESAGVVVRTVTKVEQLSILPGKVTATLADGCSVDARFAFNTTYAALNEIISKAGQAPAALKHELSEIALISPPEELLHRGVTVMDGPFFSTMPFPVGNLHSLTHVRYTPHFVSQYDCKSIEGLRHPDSTLSRVRYMIADGQRYLPCLALAEPRDSLYDIKTVLIKNEIDDGRPILYHRQSRDARLISILGGKLDNVFDLLALVHNTAPEFSAAHFDHLFAPLN